MESTRKDLINTSTARRRLDSTRCRPALTIATGHRWAPTRGHVAREISAIRAHLTGSRAAPVRPVPTPPRWRCVATDPSPARTAGLPGCTRVSTTPAAASRCCPTSGRPRAPSTGPAERTDIATRFIRSTICRCSWPSTMAQRWQTAASPCHPSTMSSTLLPAALRTFQHRHHALTVHLYRPLAATIQTRLHFRGSKHRRRRRGQGGGTCPPKIRQKYFSGNYYSGIFRQKSCKIREFC